MLIRAEKEVGPKYDRDISSFVVARLPGHFVLYESGGSSNPKYKLIPSGVSSHVALYGCESYGQNK